MSIIKLLSALFNPGGGAKRIQALDAAQAIKNGTAVLVDVRNPEEWSSGVAGPAYLLPLGDLRGARSKWKPFLDKNKDKEIIVYCASGMRSGMAASLLTKEGFKSSNLGGFSAWAAAGLEQKRVKA